MIRKELFKNTDDRYNYVEHINFFLVALVSITVI